MSFANYVELVLDARCQVDDSKAPGYPLNVFYSTNAEAFAGAHDQIISAAIYRLRLMLDPEFNFEFYIRDPIQALCDGIIDPSCIFVKDEPHPSRKTDEGKYRCITPVSLVHQLVEVCLFSEYSKHLATNLYKSGSAVGIGFSDDQTIEFCDFVNKLIDDYGPIVSDDISGFDALHTVQSLMATCRVDEFVITQEDAVDWHRANRRWVLSMSHSVSAFNGSLYQKLELGCMDSGSRDTSRRNTILRQLYSYYLGFTSVPPQPLKYAGANGDDGLSAGIVDIDSYKRAAELAGIKIRDVKVARTSADCFSFCSHSYNLTTKKASLESWPKGVYRLVTKKCEIEDAMQFAYECRHNGEIYDRILELIRLKYLYVHDELYAPDYWGEAQNNTSIPTIKENYTYPNNMARKRTSRNVSSRKQAIVFQGSQQPLLKHVTGLIDPFSEDAHGVKINDSVASSTFTYQARTHHELATDSNGNAYMEVFPTLAQTLGFPGSLGANGLTAGTPTYADVFKLTDLLVQADRFRVVSYGVSIQNAQAALSAKGRLLIRSLPEPQLAAGFNTREYSDVNTVLPMTADLNAIVVPPHNGETYLEFILPGQTPDQLKAGNIQIPYRGVGITVSSAPASVSVFNVEVVMNLELVPNITAISSRMATPPGLHSYEVLQAVHNARTSAPFAGMKTRMKAALKSAAMQALKYGAQRMLGASPAGMVSYLTGKHLPMLTNAPQIMEVD
jgi:hypothetical protein